MKKIVKDRIEKFTVYQAVDGTEFKDKEECRKYEESAKCLLFSKYSKLVVKSEREETLFKVGNYDDTVDIVKIKTQSDADIILQIFYYFNNEPSDSYAKRVEESCVSAIGSFLFVSRGYDEDNFYVMTSLPEYIKHLEDICNETN